MVKIINEFGDKLVGKSGNAIYQLVYGRQVRRKGYKEKKPPTAKQLEVRKRFKDATLWVKELPYEDRQALSRLYQTTNIAFDKKYPVNWYNFAKKLYILAPTFKILDKTTNSYQIQHPGLLSVNEYDINGLLLYSSDGLSTFDNPILDKSFQHTPIVGASTVEINMITGLQQEQTLSAIIEGLICGEISCCDPNCVL